MTQSYMLIDHMHGAKEIPVPEAVHADKDKLIAYLVRLLAEELQIKEDYTDHEYRGTSMYLAMLNDIETKRAFLRKIPSSRPNKEGAMKLVTAAQSTPNSIMRSTVINAAADRRTPSPSRLSSAA
ncbi:hypothetical protein FLP41_15235 [Paracoccus marcusii]|uniref:hypothetical protein n=1 Tax=Paracoccus marcusii TaxID=59779 RepID=UPI002ED52EC4|nr:hypothetical protein FLP41_15235 [Paracoccus marcusii]